MKNDFDATFIIHKGPLTQEQLKENKGKEILVYSYFGWRTVLIGDRLQLHISFDSNAENSLIEAWCMLPSPEEMQAKFPRK